MSDSPTSDISQETGQTYQVLARKYRPSTFEDMIGQEAMVTTLTNAFKAGRVAHAFMLTGVRGIGKTTTARLLARALNYERDGADGPSVELGTHGIHCERIMASQHMDVLEMDAASRTGVDNMREMLDGVRYAPVEARYKVYIIDEVHMLSTGAFNALLKTLEEPPDHAKFIFATTEIRKVPITVLSRCQRFDLRRVDAGALQAHLSKICTKENVHVSDAGLALIARAAEGSVRDSLSLLDQAIVQAGLGGHEVTGEQVRTMLGLADRVRVLDLFEKAANGDGAEALLEMRGQYDDGADPTIVMRDLLDICHEVSRAKTLGKDALFELAPDQITRIHALADNLSLGQLTRIWQMLLKAHTEVRMAPAPLAAAEMALLKIAVAGELPAPELVAKLLSEIKSGNFNRLQDGASPRQAAHALSRSSTAQTDSHITASSQTPPSYTSKSYTSKPQTSKPHTSQLQTSSPQATRSPDENSSQTVNAHISSISNPLQSIASHENASSSRVGSNIVPTQPLTPVSGTIILNSLEDLVAALPNERIALASDIKRYVKPIQFKHGAISFQPAQGTPSSLIGNLVTALKDLTGELWVISSETQGGGETLQDRIKRLRSEEDARDRAHPAFSHPLLMRAKLIEIMDKAPTSSEAHVSAMHFGPDSEPDIKDN